MQLPYIDDRRIALYGKVTIFKWQFMSIHVTRWIQSTKHKGILVECLLFFSKAFGGYLTLKMLAVTDKLFQCAAAAAPITDFKLYSELEYYLILTILL